MPDSTGEKIKEFLKKHKWELGGAALGGLGGLATTQMLPNRNWKDYAVMGPMGAVAGAALGRGSRKLWEELGGLIDPDSEDPEERSRFEKRLAFSLEHPWESSVREAIVGATKGIGFLPPGVGGINYIEAIKGPLFMAKARSFYRNRLKNLQTKRLSKALLPKLKEEFGEDRGKYILQTWKDVKRNPEPSLLSSAVKGGLQFPLLPQFTTIPILAAGKMVRRSRSRGLGAGQARLAKVFQPVLSEAFGKDKARETIKDWYKEKFLTQLLAYGGK